MSFTVEIVPEKWPVFMKTEEDTMELGGRRVEIKPRPSYHDILYRVYGGNRELEAEIYLTKRDGKLTKLAINILDGMEQRWFYAFQK